MDIKNYIWIIIVTTSIGCSENLEVCQKYLKTDYVNSNIEHEKLFDKGNEVEAISIVEEMVRKDLNNYIAINYLGFYKYRLCQKVECSVEELKEVYDLNKQSLELCDNFRIGYFNTIIVLAELQNTVHQNDHEIIEYLELYNSRYKKRSNLMTKGGQTMFRLGRIEQSMQYLNEAIELDSTEAMAYIFKGKCYTSQKEWKKAMEYLNHGLSLDSLSLGFHERGYVNNELGNIDEAIRDYNTAISLYDERFESYLGLGQIEINRKNVNLACQYFRKAEELKPESKSVILWLNKYCKEIKK